MELELPRENSFAGACLALHFGTFSRREAVTLMLQFVIGSRAFLCYLRRRGKLRAVPSTSQRLDQVHCRDHLLNLQSRQGLLIGKYRGLCREHVEVWIHARLIP